MSGPQLVLFSNVDGVLSEPASTPVVNAVTLLGRAHVPLVLCSSRTRAEIEHATLALGIRHPFVCERGNALFVPHGYFPFHIENSRDLAGHDVVEFGRGYDSVVETLRATGDRVGVHIRGFSDMSVQEVAEEVGLPMLVARLAKLRDYSELFRIEEGPVHAYEVLSNALDAAHLACVRGARFHHVGARVDMSLGVSMLCVLYRRAYGPVPTVGVSLEGVASVFGRLLGPTVTIPSDTPAAWAARVGSVLERKNWPLPAAGTASSQSWIL